MRTIQEQWIDYRHKVLPKNAPAIQVQETRRAFYAAAHAILMMQYEMSAQDVSDDVGVHMIESWHRECREFKARIGTPAESQLP